MGLMSVFNDKIEVEAKRAINTFSPLTKSPMLEVIMAKKSLPHVCPTCHKQFTHGKSAQIYCSRACWRVVHPTPTLSHGMDGTPECAAYRNAKSRCENSRSQAWHNYGGRGIEFRFASFEHFIGVLGNRPSDEHTLDRINNNGHYEPGNVRWASRVEQQRNTRKAICITHQGSTLSLHGWSRRLGVGKGTVARRLRGGWCIPCALSIPADKHNRCPHSPRTQ